MYFVFVYRETNDRFNTVEDITISAFPDRGDALDKYLYEKQNSPNKRVELLQRIGVAEHGERVIESESKGCEKSISLNKDDLRTELK